MALLNLMRSSKYLQNQIGVQAILPDFIKNNDKLPVIWLLHGLGDNGTVWQRKTQLEQLVSEKHVAVIMPNMNRSFYTNMVYGEKYWDYLIKELIPQMQNYLPISRDASSNYLVGNSMGGYGVLKLAFKYPKSFSAVAAISPVTDLSVVPGIMPDYKSIFGDELMDKKYQLKEMAEAQTHNLNNMSWYLSIGDDDFMKAPCDDFVNFMIEDLSIQVNYDTTSGNHDWDFWNKQIDKVINWLPLEGNDEGESL